MVGFVVGTAAAVVLLALVRVFRRRRHGDGPAGRRQWMLRRLQRLLDTTPGQEKALDQTVEELERSWMAMGEELRKSRVDLAGAMRAEHPDSSVMKEGFFRQDAALEELRRSLLQGVQRIHQALQPEQRRQLAELLEYGPRRAHCGGRAGHRRLAHHR